MYFINKFILIAIVAFNNKHKIVAEDNTSLQMYWEEVRDCSVPEDNLIDLTSVQVKKFSRNSIGITGNANIKADIGSEYMFEVKLFKKTVTGVWVPMEVPNMTSKRYDVCHAMEIDFQYLTKFLDVANIKKKCPIHKSIYSMLNKTIMYDIPKMVVPGCYRINLIGYGPTDKEVMCMCATVKIVHNGEPNHPKCI